MRPDLLKIKGINSFNTEQIIDFNRLVEKGLFGIFGPTGSGKSSILDAITLALYGNIARDSKEFINTETDKGEVNFQFQILDGKIRRTYILERGIKRKKNGGIETSVARIMEIEGEEITVLAEGVTNVNNEVVKIIGLNASDFTRSVVLPQGKFSEFLKLTGKQRRDMLERIFNLEQYGKNIIEKISSQKKKYDAKRIDIEGQLKGYEDITEERYKQETKQLEELLEKEKELRKEINKLNKEYEENKKIWDLQEELKGYQTTKKALEEKKEEIDKYRDKFKNANKANLLKPYIENLKSIEEKIAENKLKLEKLEKELPEVNNKLQEIEEKYEKALKDKEEIPNLKIKIENCKEAEELEKDSLNLKAEIKDLEEIYVNNCKAKEEKTELLDKLKTERREIQSKIKEIEKHLEKKYIESNVREGIEEAYRLQKDMEKASLDKKENKESIVQLSKVIESNRSKLKEEINKKEKIEIELNKFLEKIKELEKSPVKEEGIIFEKKSELQKKKTELAQLEENLKQKSNLDKAIKELVERRSMLENKEKDFILQIKEFKNTIETLKSEIKKIEIESLAANLASHLHEGEGCPVCGSKEHPNPVTANESELLIDKTNKLEKLEKSLIDIEKQKSTVDISLAETNKELDMKKVNSEDVEKLIKDISIEDFKNEVENQEVQLQKLTEERAVYVINKTKIEEEIDKNKEIINNTKTLIAELNIQIEKDTQTYNKLEDKVNSLCENIKEMSILIQKLKENFEIDDTTKAYNQMKAWDKERYEKEKELKNLREALEKENEQIEKVEKTLSSLEVEIAKKEQQLNENKKQLEAAIEKIKKLVEDKKPKEYRLILENKIKEIEENEKVIKERVEKGKEIQQKMIEEKAVAESNKTYLYKECNSKRLDLEKMTEEQDFNSIDEIEKYILSQKDLKELENQILEYDDEVKNTTNNINRVNKALDGKSLTVDEWQNLKNVVKEKQTVVEKRTKEIGEVQQIVKYVKEKLENVKELKKEEKKITHKLDLLSELSKMLEGNRFVEYVAINQLKYIAKEASKWLKEITRGRYALELDSSGNFIMRDDFNGGIRRATNTLSGGETFLTSLSLALALSSHIQLKGSAPLEFFFLDEGFGTLDSDLLEVVMSALERLHSEKLSVGIISHVEELKNRVPIKLVVSPAEFGGEGTVVKIV